MFKIILGLVDDFNFLIKNNSILTTSKIIVMM